MVVFCSVPLLVAMHACIPLERFVGRTPFSFCLAGSIEFALSPMDDGGFDVPFERGEPYGSPDPVDRHCFTAMA